MDEVEVEQPVTVKRKRRKSSRKQAVTWATYIRGGEFGRHLFVGMAVLGVAYAGLIMWDTRLGTSHYQSVNLRDSEAAVRYMLGTPDAVDAAAHTYRYDEKGRTVTTAFSPDGRMTAVRCVGATPGPETCPSHIGIDVGDTEFDVLKRLGTPSRESFGDDDKTMHYDDLGVDFLLSQYRVREIELREGGRFGGWFSRGLWAMLP